MANFINAFWGLFAFIFGFTVTIVFVPMITIMLNALVATGTALNVIMQIAVWLFAVVMCVAVPLQTALSDDEGGIFKRMVKRGTGFGD